MEYPKPSYTADILVFRYYNARLQLLLVERGNPPYKGCLALPGGFVEENERTETAAARELEEETGLKGLTLFPCGVFGDPGRDPRGWTVSAAFLAFAPETTQPVAGDDASAARFVPVSDLPQLATEAPGLAFDHVRIIDAALVRMRELALLTTEPLALLKEPFRTAQARHLYSQILGRPLPPTVFKAWLRRFDAVERVGPAKFKRKDRLLSPFDR